MTEEQISDFVKEVASRGCEITAVMCVGDMIGDSDLTEEQYAVVAPELAGITEHYGDRGHLVEEITNYLISIGRVFPAPDLIAGDTWPES